MTQKLFLVVMILLSQFSVARAQPLAAQVRTHQGKPTLFIDGKPSALDAFSPAGHAREPRYQNAMSTFLRHRLSAYFITIHSFQSAEFCVPNAPPSAATQPAQSTLDTDAEAKLILDASPDSTLIVRYGLWEQKNWRTAHPDQLVVTDEGKRLDVPSLASQKWWDDAARESQAVIEFCEKRPWANRIIGYANFHRVEGSNEAAILYSFYDHSPVMTARWRAFLKEKYQSDAALQKAWGDPKLTLESVEVPTSKLTGPDAANILYWQAGADNARVRDYLTLLRDLFHAGFRQIADAQKQTLEKLGRKKFLIYDALKQSMFGWDNIGFFDLKTSWQFTWPEIMSASGHTGVADLFHAAGVDGLITPHDYQARGLGGVFEPEGIADSATLRGKLMFCEMDTRSWTGSDPIFPAKNLSEFDAITWRNIATALTRGFVPYWMDVYQNWFTAPEIQPTIARQKQVLRDAVNWPHKDVPGIAMIIDDECMLETNGNGAFLNEAIMWEWKQGLARAGVPLRIYLFDDLKLDHFPDHRVFYFPNLFRVDDARLAVLKKKVFRDGHVVVWGPGSGISDGVKISADSAKKLTGFSFSLLPINYPRRVLVSDFSHPFTKGLPADTIFGGPLAYGPLLLPTDGTQLGQAWIKRGLNAAGLAVKEMDGWTSVFTITPGLPAPLWRNFARAAKAHIYSEEGDLLMASESLVAIHSLKAGPRTIHLPGNYKVTDLTTGVVYLEKSDRIQLDVSPPTTKFFRLDRAD